MGSINARSEKGMYKLKSVIRRMKSLFLGDGRIQIGQEQDATYYDKMYSESDEYAKPFWQSRYYFLWSVIVERIRDGKYGQVLEVGCGSGQFAELLKRDTLVEYTGIDLSVVAIEQARTKGLSGYRFESGDALTSPLLNADYGVLVCTEVLEHIQDDRKLAGRFKRGSRCICTVPNFPYESHVRHFKTEQDVIDRYGDLFDSMSVWGLASAYKQGDIYFLFDGVRNHNDVN